jgi:membrane-associated phospholipid phosphatase
MSARPGADRLLSDAGRIDRAVYRAVAATPTPRLDTAMRRLSRAADYSKLSIASSVVLTVLGRAEGRRAAVSGLACLASTSAAVNLVVKPLARRRRPDRAESGVPESRHVSMPMSASFPSGHTAAAVAFASGVGRVVPLASVPLHGLAALVGYSRVHTGVHYPGDVVAGALIGAVVADLAVAMINRRS